MAQLYIVSESQPEILAGSTIASKLMLLEPLAQLMSGWVVCV